MKKEQDIKIGQRIKHIRSELGLNQKEFANKIDATVSALSNWENGRNKPNDIMLNNISKIGNITVDELLHGEGYTPERVEHMLINTPDEIKKILHDKLMDVLYNSSKYRFGIGEDNYYYFHDLVDLYLKYNPNENEDSLYNKLATYLVEDFLNLAKYDQDKPTQFYIFYPFYNFIKGDVMQLRRLFPELIEHFENFAMDDVRMLKFILKRTVNRFKYDFTTAAIPNYRIDVEGEHIEQNSNELLPDYVHDLPDTLSYENYKIMIAKLNNLQDFIDTL